MNCLRMAFLFVILTASRAGLAQTAVGGCNFTLTSQPGVSYNVVSSAQTLASSLNINCSAVLNVLSSYSYTVSYGGGSSGDVVNRSMRHASVPASLLSYTLRAGSSPTSTLLGNNTNGTSVQSGTLNCLAALLGICTLGTTQTTVQSWLHIPARQFARPGSYSDSVVVTVVVN
jgi:spore coat protein U-like protein